MPTGVRSAVLPILGALVFFGLLQVAALLVGNPTPTVFRDCGWFGQGRAFIDENGNKAWDADEPPLAGVRFFVEDSLKPRGTVLPERISDEKGRAPLDLWLPGCPDVDLEVYSAPPRGYKLVTQERIRVEAVGYDEGFTFGFLPQE